MVKKDYDSAVVRIKKALARLESLATAELSAREILRLWFTAILVRAIARWEEIRKRRDISTMPETNMTVPQKNLKNVIKAGSCLTI